MSRRFTDRRQAGRLLAVRVVCRVPRPRRVVLGLGPGGVAVGVEVARALSAPLDVQVVREIELADPFGVVLGAVGSAGVVVLDAEAIARFMVPLDLIEQAAGRAARSVHAFETSCRGGRLPVEIGGADTILVSDGVMSLDAMCAAAVLVRARRPAKLAFAAPALTVVALDLLRALADEVEFVDSAEPTEPMVAYADGSPTTVDDVRRLLAESPAGQARAAP